MKIAIFYDTDTGNTQKMAEVIAKGANSVEEIEARTFPMTDYDVDFATECKCIIAGTPTYMASLTARTKTWLENLPRELGLSKKIGGAFATEGYVHGGGEMAIRSILDHFMCFGMMTYSGGGSQGKPVIHLGPVALADQLDNFTETFTLYGERMANKTKEVYSKS